MKQWTVEKIEYNIVYQKIPRWVQDTGDTWRCYCWWKEYPAPVDMENIPLFTAFYTSQVVGNGISEPSTVWLHPHPTNHRDPQVLHQDVVVRALEIYHDQRPKILLFDQDKKNKDGSGGEIVGRGCCGGVGGVLGRECMGWVGCWKCFFLEGTHPLIESVRFWRLGRRVLVGGGVSWLAGFCGCFDSFVSFSVPT